MAPSGLSQIACVVTWIDFDRTWTGAAWSTDCSSTEGVREMSDCRGYGDFAGVAAPRGSIHVNTRTPWRMEPGAIGRRWGENQFRPPERLDADHEELSMRNEFGHPIGLARPLPRSGGRCHVEGCNSHLDMACSVQSASAGSGFAPAMPRL